MYDKRGGAASFFVLFLQPLALQILTEPYRTLQILTLLQSILAVFDDFFADFRHPRQGPQPPQNRTKFDCFLSLKSPYRKSKCKCKDLTSILVNVFRGFLTRLTLTEKNRKNFFFDDVK